MEKTFKLLVTVLMEMVELQKIDNNFDSKSHRGAIINCLESIAFEANEFPENQIKLGTKVN